MRIRSGVRSQHRSCAAEAKLMHAGFDLFVRRCRKIRVETLWVNVPQINR